MMNLNNVTIVSGRLTKDPVVFEKGGTKTYKLTIAVNENFTANGASAPKTNFIEATAFVRGNQADRYAQFKKGDAVQTQGRLVSNTYEKDGATVYAQEYILEQIGFGETKAAKDARIAAAAEA